MCIRDSSVRPGDLHDRPGRYGEIRLCCLEDGVPPHRHGQCLRQRRSCRRGLRRALEEGLVKREDIFISTKLWPTLYEKAGAVDKTLERLGVDYVDLLFIQQPAGNYLAGYAAIEQAYRDGKARSLGISNFHGDKLEKLLAHADIKPHVIQLETHPYHCLLYTSDAADE